MTRSIFHPGGRNFFFLFIGLLSMITFLLSKYPGHNGDMPFYIACVIEKQQGSMVGVYQKTDSVLSRELPAREYAEHAQRLSQSDPEILERYRIKPLYIQVVLAIHQLGISYTESTVLPSLFFFFLIGVSIWIFLRQRLTPLNCLLFTLPCCLIYPTLLLARLSSPDAFSCFILLNAFFLIYGQRKKQLWLSLFLLAILIRIDNLVPELIFLVGLWKWPQPDFSNKLTFKQLIGFSGAVVLMALLVNWTFAHDFLWFQDPHFSRSPRQYFDDLALFIYVIPGSFYMTLTLIFILTGFWDGYSWKKPANYVFYLVSAIVWIRFFIYPYYDERYFTPCLLFSLLLLALRLAGGGIGLKSPSRAGG